MPCDLGREFRANYGGRFPHLSPLDSEVFAEFLKIKGMLIECIWCDVRVGKGETPPDNLPEPYRTQLILNSQKRIDAVIKFFNDPLLYICEVRPRAGPGSLGSALTVWYLFAQEDERPAKPCVITDKLAPDMRGTLLFHNVTILETGTPIRAGVQEES